MELTQKQNDLLNQLKNMNYLDNLQEKCEEFKNEVENLITERSECLNKYEMLCERLNTLKEDFKNARLEEYNLQNKLEAANQSQLPDKSDNLRSICEILGFYVSKCELLQDNGLQLTLHYRDICYVTCTDFAERFDLVEIFPHHPNFLQIKEFLQSSQDMRGLLSCLRKFFNLAIECKEKQEQI